MAEDLLNTNQIADWRSIITLVIFVVTNIIVHFPFHIPIYVPRPFSNRVLNTLSAWRVISPRQGRSQHDSKSDPGNGKVKPFVRLAFPMNSVTGPLIADIFLLAISAIGRQEVHDGTIGVNNISPINIMIFFLTLAYITISIDASGLSRYLAFKVLQKGGVVGHRLFFYLYVFFFGLGTFTGNYPIILSGTAFFAYMTRVSSNILHPRAWIHTQFAVANIASAILVSSNPTNLILASAFQIKFGEYAVNMVVPVVVTAIVLFPFLLYFVFASELLIPYSIKIHELSMESKMKRPVNPNVPYSIGVKEQESQLANNERGKLLSLEEIMNPFLSKGSATFGVVIITATLAVLLGLNAASHSINEYPIYWVTLPAALIMFSWDVTLGWCHRHETREIAHRGRKEIELAQARIAIRVEEEEAKQIALKEEERKVVIAHVPALTYANSLEAKQLNRSSANSSNSNTNADDEATISTSTRPPYNYLPPPAPAFLVPKNRDGRALVLNPHLESSVSMLVPKGDQLQNDRLSISAVSTLDEKQELACSDYSYKSQGLFSTTSNEDTDTDTEKQTISKQVPCIVALQRKRKRSTLVSLVTDVYRWLQETFPTIMAELTHLPFAFVPFALSMFVLVQALVTKGWVSVFAYGWDHWVDKTGTVGAVGGMGFLSVILCNVAGTNIGTTILLSRVVQVWQQIHRDNGIPITNRTFWATVYSIALGVNYGAFSTAFSASIAGLLWRDILIRKHIRVWRLDFARVNLPIISIAMAVGCAVLVAEVYITRDESPYDS